MCLPTFLLRKSLSTNLSFLNKFVCFPCGISREITLALDKVQTFAAQYDELFYIIKSKFFGRVKNADYNLNTDIEQEIISLFSILFKTHFEDCIIEARSLSEEIGRHALKNLTSRWLSIRNGLPIEIPFSIDPINLSVASKYLTDLVESMASQSALSQNSLKDFDTNDQTAVDPNSAAMIEVCTQVVGSQQHAIELNFGRALRALRISGVVKLHPIETTKDNPSTSYHTDGDNSLVKIILYLEENRDPYDGNFATLPCLFSDNKVGGFSPFARSFLSSHFLRDHGFPHEYAYLFNECISHRQKFTEKVLRSRIQTREYPILKWNGVMFSGSSIMHRGGHNMKSRRPVLQGYVHPF